MSEKILERKIINMVENYVKNVPRPFGLFLSGGFDSGLLAALTRPDSVFRVKFPYGSKYDESIYADSIIDHLGLNNVNIIEPTKEDFEINFPKAVKVMGEPVSHFSLVPLYMLFKKVSESGVGHILSGEGPDEYLGGYARQIIVDELRKIYSIPELRNYSNFIDGFIKLDQSIDQGQLIWRYGEIMGYDPSKVIDYYQLHREGKYPLQGIIGKMDMELGVVEKMEQKLARHFGVTLHYPYINDEFAEFCYQLPDNLKIRNGVTKWAFKKLSLRYLPETMADRPKMGGPVFPVNKLMDWMEYGEFDKTIYIRKQKEILVI